jgi:hypothetical protein
MPFDATPSPVVNPVIERLEAGLARIEKGWCQGAAAKDKNGKEPRSGKRAVSFCAAGAVVYGYKFSVNDPAVEYLLKAINQADPTIFYYPIGHRGNIPIWNDSPHRTKEDVIRLYQRAIEIAKAEVFENAV